MKYILILLVTVAAVKSQDTYDTEHDNLNVESVVADKEQFKNFIDCFTDVAPCNYRAAAAFKKELPEAVVEACAKCTPAQKHIVRVFNDSLKKNSPELYEKVKNKYDPEKKYYANFEAAVAAF